jgi:hypothetical protein
MKTPVTWKARAGIALAVAVAVPWRLAYAYLSKNKVYVTITSKSLGAILILLAVMVFVVLPVYSIIVTQEIRKRRRVEKARFVAPESERIRTARRMAGRLADGRTPDIRADEQGID